MVKCLQCGDIWDEDEELDSGNCPSCGASEEDTVPWYNEEEKDEPDDDKDPG